MNLSRVERGYYPASSSRQSVKSSGISFGAMMQNCVAANTSGKNQLTEIQKEYLRRKYDVLNDGMYFYSDKTKELMMELGEMGAIPKEYADLFSSGMPGPYRIIPLGKPEEGTKVRLRKLEGEELQGYHAGRTFHLYEGLRGMADLQRYFAKQIADNTSMMERAGIYDQLADVIKDIFQVA